MLRVQKLKPNPAGKDRPPYGGPSQTQLGAEWVDILNNRGEPYPMASVDVYHKAFNPRGGSEWALVVSFTGGALQPGHTVRVHSGSGPSEILKSEDRTGAEVHVFTDKQYVWNNAEGDTALLFDRSTKQTLDQASYAPHPPEGRVLTRAGDRLV